MNSGKVIYMYMHIDKQNTNPALLHMLMKHLFQQSIVTDKTVRIHNSSLVSVELHTR